MMMVFFLLVVLFSFLFSRINVIPPAELVAMKQYPEGKYEILLPSGQGATRALSRKSLLFTVYIGFPRDEKDAEPQYFLDRKSFPPFTLSSMDSIMRLEEFQLAEFERESLHLTAFIDRNVTMSYVLKLKSVLKQTGRNRISLAVKTQGAIFSRYGQRYFSQLIPYACDELTRANGEETGDHWCVEWYKEILSGQLVTFRLTRNGIFCNGNPLDRKEVTNHVSNHIWQYTVRSFVDIQTDDDVLYHEYLDFYGLVTEGYMKVWEEAVEDRFHVSYRRIREDRLTKIMMKL